MAAPAPHAIDLTLTFGVFQVGVSIAMFLVGVCTLQVWNYFRNFPEDPKGVKLLVGVVYAGDLVHSVLLMHSVYHYTILNFGNPAALGLTVNTLQVSVLFVGGIAFVVQTFFCLRVLRITESKILALGCFALTLVRIGFNISIAVNVFIAGNFAAVETDFKWLIVTTLCVGAASDVAIAACMCMGLMRRRTGFAPTDKLVDKLIAYIIGSGLLTSVVAVVEVVCFLTMVNFVWLMFYTILAKLFSNSLLASLNERNSLRQKMSSVNVQDSSLRSGTRANLSQPSRLVFAKQQQNSAVELTSIGNVPPSGKAYGLGYTDVESV
ncbi:hypothetical protein EXIGLDRAFT_841506 [Exidia glandulosa HHB12029]|uniref:DUF6534 domain-containing protein n=1 Tax=Exidia glandulosa HHB12029 TaxID=1314781 RepID=A0A165AYM5_EXIGL|nr:hypothetical protein EXIGLDRAFT_846424 [Exidia glandulosa HHB12029]KZV85443.1 hypothetical protein EXIGLDRAFT_841506 [Exidia glandulosa HHB12029]